MTAVLLRRGNVDADTHRESHVNMKTATRKPRRAAGDSAFLHGPRKEQTLPTS